MNKHQLVNEAAKTSKESKTSTLKTVNAIIAAIKKSLKKGDSVKLYGFGTFKVGKRKERMGINPSTGKKMKIAAKKYPKITFSKVFKDSIGSNKK